MHQTTSAKLDNAMAARPLPAQQHPATEPRWVRIGRGTYPFSSYAEVSAAYRSAIERLGLGVSQTPTCDVLDGTGNVVAQVAYNGRIFAVDADGEADRGIVLYETRGG